MRPSSTVRVLLRAAVLDALAVACAMPFIGCGGALDRSVAQDADPNAPSSPSAISMPPDVDSSIPTNVPGPVSAPSDDASVHPSTVDVIDAAVPIQVDAPIVVQEDAAVVVVLVDAAWQGDGRSPSDGSAIGEASVSADSGPPPDGSCVRLAMAVCAAVTMPCLPPALAIGGNGSAACAPECGINSFGCTVAAVSGGYTLQCLCGGGRFPAGLEILAPGKSRGALGAYLALSAALEASSVRAFVQLARELTAHGAPKALVARTRAAARQETQHARLLRQAAESHGASVPRMRARRVSTQVRSIYELAMENAVEGCGRETLGAALLQFQALRASDSALRTVLVRVAEDETEHAELAWDLQEWLESKLDSASCKRVRAARVAFLAMCGDEGPPTDARVAGPLGLPAPRQWRALVEVVRAGPQTLAA